MSGPFGSSQWMYATGEQPFYSYTIDNSLRFDGVSYLQRTPSTAGNQDKFTLSMWVKLNEVPNNTILVEAGSGGLNRSSLGFTPSGQLQFLTVGLDGQNYAGPITTRVFRDVCSWYHLCLVYDSSLTTSVDIAKIYCNGVRITDVTQPYDALQQNDTTYINSSQVHRFNSLSYSVSNHTNCYVSEIHLLDGISVGETGGYLDEFGELKQGVWIPKAYSGIYGTNGFYLSFADSAAIGDDLSGNANDWTPSGLASTDVLLDSPTNNFATYSPIDTDAATFAEGNLSVSMTAAAIGISRSSMAVSSGKWYWEHVITGTSQRETLGIALTTVPVTSNPASTSGLILTYGNSGNIYYNGSDQGAYMATYGNGDIIGIAFDADAGSITYYKNGVSQGVGYASIPSGTYAPFYSDPSSSYATGVIANFGQDSSFAGNKTRQGNTDTNGRGDFYYAPPSGYLTLCTQNLPAPTFDPAQGASPLDAFNSVLYDGDGIDAHAITGVGFSPDFTWIKARGPNGRYHRLTDTVRGATRSLTTNGAFGEDVDSTHLQSFDADGFTLGTQASFNASGETYVAWNWKLGGSSNTFNIDGTGYSTASAAGLDSGTQNPTGATVNTEAGIGIYTYTGDGTTKTIAHGLGETPSVVIIKNRSNVGNWLLYTNAVDGSMDFGYINSTNAFSASGRNLTSTTFDHNNDAPQGTNGDDYVAWVFAEKEGFSKFGSYYGNASADGTFVYTGFRPAWIMVKPVNGTGSWSIVDNKRDGYNVDNDRFLAESTNIEDTTDYVDILANGFKFRSNTGMNAAYTYIYMAFAEQPFKYSNAR